jgi:hypothetical protein
VWLTRAEQIEIWSVKDVNRFGHARASCCRGTVPRGLVIRKALGKGKRDQAKRGESLKTAIAAAGRANSVRF